MKFLYRVHRIPYKQSIIQHRLAIIIIRFKSKKLTTQAFFLFIITNNSTKQICIYNIHQSQRSQYHHALQFQLLSHLLKLPFTAKVQMKYLFIIPKWHYQHYYLQLNIRQINVVSILTFFITKLSIRLYLDKVEQCLCRKSNSYLDIELKIITLIIYNVITIITLLICNNLQIPKNGINDYLAKYSIEQVNMTAQDILSILVSRFVRKKNKYQMKYIKCKAQDDESNLLAYICDVNTIMKEENNNVVVMLGFLFRLFDHLCIQLGVQKIGYIYGSYRNKSL
ncbi:unnamed protein product [Paramecium sonneborni]|uniref:Transmembrane protein n=1 Tax=Paramecium sonneborni TaxID=65129 RepID=A0A8S1RS03_9CILI|nr:unnamed protein product [Paramecium sonneborni]